MRTPWRFKCQVAEPQFEGQTKKQNSVIQSSKCSEVTVYDQLNEYLEQNENRKKSTRKVVLAAEAREAARKARQLVQRKSIMSGGGPWINCLIKDPEHTEIYPIGPLHGGSAKWVPNAFPSYSNGEIYKCEKAKLSKRNSRIEAVVTALGTVWVLGRRI